MAYGIITPRSRGESPPAETPLLGASAPRLGATASPPVRCWTGDVRLDPAVARDSVLPGGRRGLAAGEARKARCKGEAAVLLSGVLVDDRMVLQLARLVEQSLGAKLVTAYRLRSDVVALTYVEREAIVSALESTPSQPLLEIREAFLRSEAWRPRERVPHAGFRE